MSWHVHLDYNPPHARFELYVWQETNAQGRQLLRIQGESSSLEPWPEHERKEPTLALPARSGNEVLAGLAAQLAQHGFTELSNASVVKAQHEHIASLEKQAERLFTLAGGSRDTGTHVKL